MTTDTTATTPQINYLEFAKISIKEWDNAPHATALAAIAQAAALERIAAALERIAETYTDAEECESFLRSARFLGS